MCLISNVGFSEILLPSDMVLAYKEFDITGDRVGITWYSVTP